MNEVVQPSPVDQEIKRIIDDEGFYRYVVNPLKKLVVEHGYPVVASSVDRNLPTFYTGHEPEYWEPEYDRNTQAEAIRDKLNEWLKELKPASKKALDDTFLSPDQPINPSIQ